MTRIVIPVFCDLPDNVLITDMALGLGNVLKMVHWPHYHPVVGVAEVVSEHPFLFEHEMSAREVRFTERVVRRVDQPCGCVFDSFDDSVIAYCEEHYADKF